MMAINNQDQAASELRRIPVDYLEHIGKVNDRVLPPLADPFSATEPFVVDGELFNDGDSEDDK
jgi:hypothetical protein